MTISLEPSFVDMAHGAYASAIAYHGDLSLSFDGFLLRLRSIVEKHLGISAPTSEALTLCGMLHMNDLYLALSCSRNSDTAWCRFCFLYERHIREIARFVCSTAGLSRDLADSMIGHIFLPGSSGQSRIASYDGRCSMSTWLRAVIKHRAINERNRRLRICESLDNATEAADSAGLKQINFVETSGYQAVVIETLRRAVESLSAEEQRILALKYVEGQKGIAVAERLGLHASSITRRLTKIHTKIRDQAILILATEFVMNNVAIKECLAEIVENPAYSVVQFLKC